MPKGTQLVLGNGSGSATSPEDKESQIKAIDVLCSGAGRELREHLSEVEFLFFCQHFIISGFFKCSGFKTL